MFLNYFKSTIRNLRSNKAFSIINITGLAVGLAASILMIVYVTDELQFDKHNKNANRIYRVDGDIKFGGNHFILAVAPDPLGPALKNDFPQVEQYVRFRNHGSVTIKKGEEVINEDKVVYVDSTLFNVFTFHVIAGNPQTALVAPKSIVLTESKALKYFASTNVVGRFLNINGNEQYKVTAVVKDMPAQSHFRFDFFISLSTLSESRQNNWLSNNFNTYVLLRKGADPKALEAQFPAMVDKYFGPKLVEVMNVDLNEFKKSGNYAKYELTPLTAIHLHSNKVAELGANNDMQMVYIFGCVGLLILLIACVNFMNLSTARSARRAKEVGVRKVLGSAKSGLVIQFIFESLFLTFISVILAFGLAWMVLPFFNQLSGKEFTANVLFNLQFVPVLIVLIVAVGILAGLYPAFYLSSFNPAKVLKGKLTEKGKGNNFLRSSLVVFQFSISVVLIISTLVIYHQLNFIRNKDVGFNRDQVLIIKNASALGEKDEPFKNELKSINGVDQITSTGYLPTSGWRSDSPLFTEATLNQKTALSTQMWQVDENYLPTLGIKILKGRNFDKNLKTDSNAIIINQTAAKLLGMEDPVNQMLYNIEDFSAGHPSVSAYRIIGVIQDFNFNSLREEVTPLTLFYEKNNASIAIRIHTSDIAGLVGKIEKEWKKMVPGQSLDYSFMDEDFNKIYHSEQRTATIFISFASLAIFIACLGLFGLSAFAAEQRTKEIGVRKVLGASVGKIVTLLSTEFLKLVGIAFLIAFPISWWIMTKWLQQFAYRTSIGFEVFLIAGFSAIFIALLTVSFQAVKAAMANPIISLRGE